VYPKNPPGFFGYVPGCLNPGYLYKNLMIRKDVLMLYVNFDFIVVVGGNAECCIRNARKCEYKAETKVY